MHLDLRVKTWQYVSQRRTVPRAPLFTIILRSGEVEHWFAKTLCVVHAGTLTVQALLPVAIGGWRTIAGVPGR